MNALVFVTYGEDDLVMAAVDAAFGCEVFDFVLIVDNLPSDGLRDRLDRLPAQVRYLRAPTNLGYGGACNFAYRWLTAEGASPDVIVVANPDVSVTCTVLESLVRAAAQPDVGVVGPSIHDPSGCELRYRPFPPPLLYFLDPLRRGPARLPVAESAPSGPPVRRVQWLSGCLMAISGAAFADVGGFDEEFFLIGEDYDLCRSIAEAGYVVLHDSRISVGHQGGHTMGRQPDARLLQSHVSKLRIYHKWYGPWGARISAIQMVAESAIKIAAFVAGGSHSRVAAYRSVLRVAMLACINPSRALESVVDRAFWE